MTIVNPDYVKEHYDKVAGKYKKEYEYWRWKETKPKRRNYEQTLKSLQYHFNGYRFNNLLEIGSGAGTWTRFFMKKAKNLTLLDISKGMIEKARKRFGNKNMKYIARDFGAPETKKESVYDCIASVRAIEYMKNKEKVIRNIYKLLKRGGRVFIITKNPKRELRKRIPFLKFFMQTPEIHRDWIDYVKLSEIFKKAGFREIEVYPVIVHAFLVYETKVHIKLSQKIFNRIYKKPLKNKCPRFIESYIIKAKK